MAEVTCGRCGAVVPEEEAFVEEEQGGVFCRNCVEEQVEEEGRLLLFQQILHAWTPQTWMTPVLVGVNVLIFLVMVISGVHFFSPKVPDLIAWGANFGPLTFSGEWWRLFTCMFLHIGILHVTFNMWVLWDAGPLVERLVGPVGFLVLYVFSGLMGSLVSLGWRPTVVSAGASGAIFGVFGGLLAILLLRRGAIPWSIFSGLRNSILAFLLFNIAFGATLKNVDLAAHLGGLVAGFLAGLVVSHAIEPGAARQRLWRNVLLVFVGGLVVAGTAWALPRAKIKSYVRVQRALKQFGKVERRSLQAYNKGLKKVQSGEMSDAEFARVLQRDVLGPWRKMHQRLKKIEEVPPSYKPGWTPLLLYISFRQQGWELFLQGIQQKSKELILRSRQKHDKAETFLKKYNKLLSP